MGDLKKNSPSSIDQDEFTFSLRKAGGEISPFF